MSVNPGFGGQKFIPRSLQQGRPRYARLLDRAGNTAAPIEIDGGIDLSNIARAVDAGVEIVVAGSAIFNAPDPDRSDQGSQRRRGGSRFLMTAQTPQTINIRVRYAETDKMGVVYHANYFMWFEIGRCELLRVDWPQLSRDGGVGHRPASHRGALRIQVAGALRR